MRFGILATNGGPHSAEKWAIVTAGQIIQVGADATGTQALEARKLENKIVEILEGHHGKVQGGERKQLATLRHERLGHGLDDRQHVDAAAIVAEIVAAAKGSPFADHFGKPDVQDYLGRMLGEHFRTVMDIERSWHADRHPDSAHARAFKARRLG